MDSCAGMVSKYQPVPSSPSSKVSLMVIDSFKVFGAGAFPERKLLTEFL